MPRLAPRPARSCVRTVGSGACGTEQSLREKIAEARRLDEYGIDYAVLTGAQLREIEPHVSEKIVGAIHFRSSPTSSDPGMLTKAYADLFVRKGGRFLKGDARRLAQDSPGWGLPAKNGPISAPEAVVALGPWSDDVFGPLGYDSRWPSSVATTCIMACTETPCSAIRCMTPTAATCWCR